MPLYHYLGSKRIRDLTRHSPPGLRVETAADVLRWIRDSKQDLDRAGRVIATFIIDESGCLRIADRRSEHVACAGGEAVQSAGEITFEVIGQTVRVVEVTNQSTGYCPEPESWPAVEAALPQAGLGSPSGFSQAFLFRRCLTCATLHIVKDGVFECGSCGESLPAQWNCSD